MTRHPFPSHCSESEIQIPLHIGENRSRTWIITRTAQGLRLKHDHRIEDGTDDPVTQYGGDTAERGTAMRQSFPADAFTAQLLPEAATNVWTITLTPGERLHYHLTRHGSRALPSQGIAAGRLRVHVSVARTLSFPLR